MATPKFACPECGSRLKASIVEPGSTVDCPKCGKSITVPHSLDEAGETKSPVTEDSTDEAPFRIKAPWEYAKEWARVRFALVLCTIAAVLTSLELLTGEVTDRLFHRAYTPTEIYVGLMLGLLIGAFRIYAKCECRHVPRQWGPRPLLWVCVGVEVALLLVATATAVKLAATPPLPVEELDLPPELKKILSPADQQEYLKHLQQSRDLLSGT